MAVIQASDFPQLYAVASPALPGPRTTALDDAARIELWKAQEWHGWNRWRICRRDRIDYSKPVNIGLLVAGFGLFIGYGVLTGKMFVTAGGVVFWFAAVNLFFFTYFGLSLPGPPRAIPGPFTPGTRFRAIIGLYPAGYERRKLARLWIKLPSDHGEPWLIELPIEKYPPDLHSLMERQATWRIQRADAPATEAVIETRPVTREQIDAGEPPLKVLTWRWDETALTGFKAAKL